MTNIDYLVFAIYIAGTAALGGFYYFRNQSTDEMFSAGGQAPWWVSGLSGFMTIFSAATFVVWGGIAYKFGVVALVINMTYGIAALLVGIFIAGRWKEMGVESPSEYFLLRFGPAAVQLYIWVMLVLRILGTAVALYGLAVLLVALMPLAEGNPLRDPETGTLAAQWAIIVLGTIVVLYTMAGGLWSVLMTDVVQFIIVTLSVLFVTTLTLAGIDDVDAVLANTPETFFNIVNDEYSWYFMAAWILINFVTIGAEWAFAQRYVSVRTRNEARKSAFLIAGLYFISPFVWLLPPLLYRGIEPGLNHEQAYILASQAVLPVGMMGLMAAALFSATASQVSSQLNVFAGALSKQFYRDVFRPNADEAELVWAGRVSTIILGAVIVTIALAIPLIGGAARLLISKSILVVTPLMLPAIWGMFSRSLPTRAVWLVAASSVIVGLVFKGMLQDGGVLSDFALFAPLANWIDSSPRLADMVIGIVTPAVTILLVQLGARGVDPGWQRLEQCERAAIAHPVAARFDPTPAWIVVIALGLCALIVTVVALISGEDFAVLLTFIAILLGLALLISLAAIKASKASAASASIAEQA